MHLIYVVIMVIFIIKIAEFEVGRTIRVMRRYLKLTFSFPLVPRYLKTFLHYTSKWIIWLKKTRRFRNDLVGNLKNLCRWQFEDQFTKTSLFYTFNNRCWRQHVFPWNKAFPIISSLLEKSSSFKKNICYNRPASTSPLLSSNFSGFVSQHTNNRFCIKSTYSLPYIRRIWSTYFSLLFLCLVLLLFYLIFDSCNMMRL